MADLISAATASVPLIRVEEFRKNAVKAGWELWDAEPTPSEVSPAGAAAPGNQGSVAS